jgi:hypothetical protein
MISKVKITFLDPEAKSTLIRTLSYLVEKIFRHNDNGIMIITKNKVIY